MVVPDSVVELSNFVASKDEKSSGKGEAMAPTSDTNDDDVVNTLSGHVPPPPMAPPQPYAAIPSPQRLLLSPTACNGNPNHSPSMQKMVKRLGMNDANAQSNTDGTIDYAPQLPNNLANRTCPHCLRVYASMGALKYHMGKSRRLMEFSAFSHHANLSRVTCNPLT